MKTGMDLVSRGPALEATEMSTTKDSNTAPLGAVKPEQKDSAPLMRKAEPLSHKVSTASN